MKLSSKKCKPCEGGVKPLSVRRIRTLMKELHDWKLSPEGSSIHKVYSFKNFKETFSFARKVAALAEREGHHPDMHLSYDTLELDLSTHAIDGLSENDFILASKIDLLKL